MGAVWQNRVYATPRCDIVAFDLNITHLEILEHNSPRDVKLGCGYEGMGIEGHGFHSLRRSGATLAFDNNVQLQDIMAHGLWRSSAVWCYLQSSSLAPSIIPTTFSSVILGLGFKNFLNENFQSIFLT